MSVSAKVDKEGLSAEDFRLAADSNSACNLSGIVYAFANIMPRIWAEAQRVGGGTRYVNEHPISRLFAEQIEVLTRRREYGDAYELVKLGATGVVRGPKFEPKP